jgi:hypothetical protein
MEISEEKMLFFENYKSKNNFEILGFVIEQDMVINQQSVLIPNRNNKKPWRKFWTVNIDFINNVLENKPNSSKSLRDITNIYNSKYKEHQVSRSTMYKVLKKRMKLSYSKVLLANNKIIDYNYLQNEKCFIKKLTSVVNSDMVIIFIDETKFSCHNEKFKTWNNEYINNVKLWNGDERNTNVIFSCSPRGFKFYKLEASNIDAFIFTNYLKMLLEEVQKFPELSKAYSLRKITLLMDNASIHRASQVRDYIKNSNFRLVYSPPYRSIYNLCEYIFAILKKKYYKEIFHLK